MEGPYEMAEHCVRTETNVLILLNAWLFSGNEDGDGELRADRRDWGTLNYWAARLRPLWSKEGRSDNAQDTGRETKVVICNRCGEENGKRFRKALHCSVY